MKTLRGMLIVSVGVGVLFLSRNADACHSCAGWGSTWGKRLDVCASPSEVLLDDLIACDRINCAVECSAFLASYDACGASGDPACQALGDGNDDCSYCQAGVGPWIGVGCNAELNACSYDRTGCTPCAAWLFDGGDSDNLCYPEAVYASIDVSACACFGACAPKCAAACGGGYLAPELAGFKCGACLASACEAPFDACSSI